MTYYIIKIIIFIFSSKEILLSISQPLILVIGWFVAFILNNKLQQKQLNNSAKIKIYEELYKQKIDIDKTSTNLGLLLTEYAPPFLEMSFEDKKNNVNAGLKSLDHWFKYKKELTKTISSFVNKYIKLWNHCIMWSELMPGVKKPTKILFEELLRDLHVELWEYARYLSDQTTKEYDWHKWNQNEIKYKANNIGDKFNIVAIGYIDDYMTIIHNELLSPILGYKKIYRENFQNLNKLNEYYILTKNGLQKKINKEA